jgi:hypothetical protein
MKCWRRWSFPSWLPNGDRDGAPFALQRSDSHIVRMSLRLWRRKQLFPGLRMNLSRSGVSLSLGRRGAWYTSGRRGQRVTLGAPGTGLFWTEKLEPRRTASQAGRQWLGVLLALAAIVGLVMVGNWIAAHP